MLGWNEFHIQGLVLILEVLEAAGEAAGGGFEGFGLVIGLAAGASSPR